MIDLRLAILCSSLPMLGFVNPPTPPAEEPPQAVESTAAPETNAPESSPQEQEPLKFLRVVNDPNKSLQLQVAVQQFKRVDGAGPTVSLVGVAHIGERRLYRKLQNTLNQHDVVLFESVKPAGTGGAGGDTPEERIESTREAMRFLASLITKHEKDLERLPKDFGELKTYAAQVDSRLGAFVDSADTDAWDRPFVYQREAETFSLSSLGADGARGGEDENADIELADLGPIEPRHENDEDSLQADLARTLNLQFQLDGIDYDHESWRCSDMAIDQVERAMKEKGSDFSIVSGALAGSSFPAQIVKAILGMVRFADMLLDGMAVEMLKIMIIEMLGDETVMRESIRQFGPGFNEVIVEQRNQVVIDDLKQILETDPEVKSVAVFYGAAHMPDLAQRLLDQLQYEPAGETEWIEAISVDLANSKLSPQEIRQLRQALRQAIRQQFGPPRARRSNSGHNPAGSE